MPREYRNFNNVGKVSGLLLLALALLAINPIANSSAFAEEDVEDNYFETSFGGSDGSNDTDGIVTLADANTSIVGISFSPATYYADLAPTNVAGQLARIDFSATVNVYLSNGYSVYLKSTSPNLTGVSNSNNIIPSATSAKTYANMDVNTWGYASSVGSAITDAATYKAVGVSGNGDKIAENTSGGLLTDSKTINLSFATKLNDQKPADTYRNTMIMSVVSSPLKVADDWGITEMQLMTSAICTNAKDTNGDGEIATQLKDTRDGKYYWVSKLADDRCWMTQNLDLDLNASTTPLTSATSDVSADWIPGDNGISPAYTATILSSSTLYSGAGQRSWSLGNYRIINPTTNSNCGEGKNSAADCLDQFTAYNTPTTANGDTNAHYILGNHYQWKAATTGGTITDGQASSSICPKGWRLPTGDYSTGEFTTLITAGNIGSDVTGLTSSPYYFVRGGFIYQSGSNLFRNAGSEGDYWSSTSAPTVNGANRLSFVGDNSISASGGSYNLDYGLSVRCIAR